MANVEDSAGASKGRAITPYSLMGYTYTLATVLLILSAGN